MKVPLRLLLIEPVMEAGVRLFQRRKGGAIDAVQIRPAVVVKIDHGQTAQHGFDLIFAAGGIVAQEQNQARNRAPHFASGWTRSHGRCPRLPGQV